jgi:hypothetical protein
MASSTTQPWNPENPRGTVKSLKTLSLYWEGEVNLWERNAVHSFISVGILSEATGRSCWVLRGLVVRCYISNRDGCRSSWRRLLIEERSFSSSCYKFCYTFKGVNPSCHDEVVDSCHGDGGTPGSRHDRPWSNSQDVSFLQFWETNLPSKAAMRINTYYFTNAWWCPILRYFSGTHLEFLKKHTRWGNCISSTHYLLIIMQSLCFEIPSGEDGGFHIRAIFTKENFRVVRHSPFT